MKTLLPLLFLAAVLLAACGGDDDDAPTPTPQATATAADSESVKETAPPSPSTEASPTAVATQAAGPASDEPVRFMTPDGVTIQGHLYMAPGPKQTAVILAHEFEKDQTTWSAFAQELAGQGIAALTFDFRGYGESEGEKETAKIDQDLEIAVRYLQSQDFPRIYVIGASMGGTATMKVAARLDLAGIVVLSAPPEIRGLDATGDAASIDEPKLFMAASDDAGGAFAAAMQVYVEQAPEPVESLVLEGSAHGTELLDGPNAAEVKQAIFSFVGGQ